MPDFFHDSIGNALRFTGNSQPTAYYTYQASGRLIISDPRLYLWWKLEEGSGTIANDSSAYRNTGTLTNMEAGDWVAGNPILNFGNSYSLQFDGGDEYVEATLAGLSDLVQGFSLSCWVYLDSVPSSSYYLLASFDATNGTDIMSYVPEVGSPATDTNITAVITGNKATDTDASSYPSGYIVWETGHPDVTIMCDITINNNTGAGIVFNWVDASNHWVFRGEPVNGGWLLREETSNTIRGSYLSTPVIGQTYAVKVITQGDSVKCYVDDVLVVTYLTIGRPSKAGTKHGIGNYATFTGSTFDNLTVF